MKILNFNLYTRFHNDDYNEYNDAKITKWSEVRPLIIPNLIFSLVVEIKLWVKTMNLDCFIEFKRHWWGPLAIRVRLGDLISRRKNIYIFGCFLAWPLQNFSRHPQDSRQTPSHPRDISTCPSSRWQPDVIEGNSLACVPMS